MTHKEELQQWWREYSAKQSAVGTVQDKAQREREWREGWARECASSHGPEET
jgi:hypothetical protein